MKVYRKTVENFVKFICVAFDIDLAPEDVEYITDQICIQKPLPKKEADSGFIIEWDGADWKKFFEEVLEEKYGSVLSKEKEDKEDTIREVSDRSYYG